MKEIPLAFWSVPADDEYLSAGISFVAGGKVVLPLTPFGGLFGFGPLPLCFLVFMESTVAFYILAAEKAKRVFYREIKPDSRNRSGSVP